MPYTPRRPFSLPRAGDCQWIPALLEEWMMTGLVSILIIFMGFIVWDLAKKSKAGRFGSFILFFVLGLGVAAFIIKSVVIGLIESGAL
ncbi:DUF2788 domain-containing protein [Pseudomonas sp. R4-79]